DDQLDLVIFGGSIHYATSLEETLREALRVLRRDGKVVILDSPVYGHTRSGEQMVAELQQQLAREHSIDASVLPHENFLTPRRLSSLGAALGIRWRLKEPFYGWRWALAPWLARLRGRRQPARFYLITGERHP
ncbi:MAG: class I SAM-dependent methyltransferase, partial [Chloroflexota bacterium]